MPAVRARRAGRALTVAGDYLLLLAALLVSADLAYAERQFTLLGPLWSWHLLLLAIVHAAIAYAFASPLVLAASLTALAGWFGVGGTFGDALLFSGSTPHARRPCPPLRRGDRGLRVTPIAARARDTILQRRVRSLRGEPGVLGRDRLVPRMAVARGRAAAAGALLAWASVRRGLDTGRESFLVYGIVYAAIGLCAAAVPHLHGITTSLGFVLVVVCAAAAALWQLRRRLREPGP